MRIATLSLLAALMACSSKDLGSPQAEPPVRVELAWRIEPAAEEYVCRWFVVPESGLDVGHAAYELGEGSHHLLLWSTSLTADALPNDEALIRRCDADAPSHAVLTGLLLGAQPGSGSFAFPEGAALRLAAGQVLLVEHHAVNASSEPADVQATLVLHPAAEPIRQEVGLLHYYDWAISVPPASRAHSRMRCVVPETIRLLSAHGHMHERGKAFRAWRSVDGATATFYASQAWDAAPTALLPPVDLVAGERIEFECAYDNPGPLHFYQGLSARLSEMCSFTAFYTTESGQRLAPGAEWCAEPGSGVVGQGSLDCRQIEDCMASVLASVIDPLGRRNGAQDCWLAGCPDAAPAFVQLATCRAAHCSQVCGLLPDSAGFVASAFATPECEACVASMCADGIAECGRSECAGLER